MNFSKILTSFVAITAAANMSVYGGLGATASAILNNAFKTGDKMFSAADIDATGDFEKNSSNTADVISFNKDTKGYYPVGVFGEVMLTFDGFAGPLTVGVALKGGYRWNFGGNTDRIYGVAKHVAPVAGTVVNGFSVTYPSGSFFVEPTLVIGAAIADMHFLVKVGLDISRATFSLNYNDGTVSSKISTATADFNTSVKTDASAWLFGFVAGLQAIFQVGPCMGIGASIDFKYWPTSWNDVKDSGVAKKFNAKLADDAVVANIGGTYAVTFGLTGYINM